MFWWRLRPWTTKACTLLNSWSPRKHYKLIIQIWRLYLLTSSPIIVSPVTQPMKFPANWQDKIVFAVIRSQDTTKMLSSSFFIACSHHNRNLSVLSTAVRLTVSSPCRSQIPHGNHHLDSNLVEENRFICLWMFPTRINGNYKSSLWWLMWWKHIHTFTDTGFDQTFLEGRLRLLP